MFSDCWSWSTTCKEGGHYAKCITYWRNQTRQLWFDIHEGEHYFTLYFIMHGTCYTKGKQVNILSKSSMTKLWKGKEDMWRNQPAEGWVTEFVLSLKLLIIIFPCLLKVVLLLHCLSVKYSQSKGEMLIFDTQFARLTWFDTQFVGLLKYNILHVNSFDSRFFILFSQFF